MAEIASAANYDKIAVTGAPGTATVGGTLTPTLLGGYIPAPNQLFPGIVTATGGIIGQFDAISSTLGWKLIYYANSIDLMYQTLLNLAAGTTTTIAPGQTMDIGGPGNTLTNNGNLTVNGTLNGNLTNNAGGFVGGSGMITGNLINNGTVNPGNSPGTLTVGTYTVNPGGTHVVEIASASSYDKLVATAAGGVTLNGGTLSPRLLGGYLPSVNQVFANIISNTGGGTVAGTFASIDNTRIGNSRTLFWQALYNPSSVDLQAVGNYTPADLSLSRNQRSVGNMLNALRPP